MPVLKSYDTENKISLRRQLKNGCVWVILPDQPNQPSFRY